MGGSTGSRPRRDRAAGAFERPLLALFRLSGGRGTLVACPTRPVRGGELYWTRGDAGARAAVDPLQQRFAASTRRSAVEGASTLELRRICFDGCARYRLSGDRRAGASVRAG